MPTDLFRFAAFELDRGRRALLLEGQELPLQPRVFDLLVYLIEHRDRVVSKDELLEALWPGVVVTEGSLQRAVSLARAALQQGGLDNAIRNYARRGYRFDIDEFETAAPPQSAASVSAAEAERLFGLGRWRAAVDSYAATDRIAPLDGEALERWATAAQFKGDLKGAVAPLERAAVVYSSQGNSEAAARATLSLARIQLESLDLAVAQGCLRRAARLLSGLPPGEMHGYLAWMTARLCLSSGDLPEAARHAVEARDLGRALSSPDIESMGLLLCGMALQACGDTTAGLELQDESAAAVLAGNVSPLIGGLVYCGVIASCSNCGDWQRAEEWTDSFTRWCERNGIDTFSGACLIHRAELYAISGRLREARETLSRADPVIRAGAPWALGDASRLLGDVHLARGEDQDAERNYQHAHENGWDPYPGFALLLHRRGRSTEALRGLKRAAELASYVAGERKARYLAHAVQIAALAGDLDEARTLLESLEKQAGTWAVGAVAGQVDVARAEVLWAGGDHEEALRAFRRATEILRQKRALMDVALTRLRLAEVLAAHGEPAAAELELRAAEAQFEASDAIGYLARCRALREGMIGSTAR
jgi:DNA-binding winged helix-turn-helix (wHTH) protein/ATP/maltotriose-dependent transcriptional regulator MalT